MITGKRGEERAMCPVCQSLRRGEDEEKIMNYERKETQRGTRWRERERQINR